MWKFIIGGVAVLLAILVMFYVAALWLIKPPSLNTHRDDPKISQVLDEWFVKMNQSRMKKFNGVVLIRLGDQVVLKKGYGVDGYKRPLTDNSSLRLASLSKQFTAVGILTLVRDGNLDLDEPITTYLPNCPFETVTLRKLLNHTSGIPINYMYLTDNTELMTLERAERLVCEQDVEIDSEAGYAYSNTGYILAARIVEIVSQQSFEDYMKEAIFDPLNMKNSRVWNLVSSRPFPERAVGFDMLSKDADIIEPTLIDGVAGDGAVFSTLNDLENWDRFWTDERLLPQALKEEAMTAGAGNYGLGLVRDGDKIWHNGQWLAARSYMSRDLKTGDLVIMIDNGDNEMSFDSIQEILQARLNL